MTNIQIRHNDGIYTIKIKGHATGSEETCNAISMLVYTIGGYLLNNEDKINIKKFKLNYGDIEFIFSDKGYNNNAQIVYDIAYIGLKQLEQDKKEFVSFL